MLTKSDASQWLGAQLLTERTLDFRAILLSFWRRRMVFLSVVVVTVAFAGLVSLVSPREYTATTQIMIDLKNQPQLNLEDAMQGAPPDTRMVDTEVKIMQSRSVAEKVVSTLRLDKDPEFNSRLRPLSPIQQVTGAIKGLINASAPTQAEAQATAAQPIQKVADSVLSNVAAKRSGASYIIDLAITTSDPKKSAAIANAFGEAYMLSQLDSKFDNARRTNLWLNDRLGELQKQVMTAESAAANYRADNNLMSAQGATLTEQEISNLNQQLAAARADEAAEQARLTTARNQLARGSSGDDVGEALGSSVVQNLRAQRVALSNRVADLQGRYGPMHPEMLKSQRELSDIDGQIQAEIGRIISNLEARVQVARQRTASIAASVAGSRGNLATNNRAAVRLGELQRNADANRALYESFLTSSKGNAERDQIEQPNARIITTATPPGSPSAPNVKLNLALGLALGMMAGVGAVVAANALDGGLTTAEEIESALGRAHLGSIPTPASSIKGSLGAGKPIDFVLSKPLSGFAEGFRGLRAALLHGGAARPRVIAITSALPGEGKTTTSMALGRAMAMSGDKVVVVDCDLRHQSIREALGIPVEVGLMEVLAGANLDVALIDDRGSGLKVLALSGRVPHARDILGSPAMDKLLTDLQARFDIVLLDCAPVLPVAEARIMSAKADVVVVLVRWRKTSAKAVKTALRLLEQIGAKVVGVALTQVNLADQARYGYGDAGYYYKSYQKYYSE